MQENITLKQLPIIVHRLSEIGQKVSDRIEALELDHIIITEDSRKSFKATRSELNKEFAEFEAQKKRIQADILKPYNEFLQVYNLEISEKYGKAELQLKDGIAIVENQLKQEKKDNLIAYFEELNQSLGLDFITFENIGLEFNLTVTEKKLKEETSQFLYRVKDDLRLIETQKGNEIEIMLEYKKHLNVLKAISEVTERVRLESEEREKRAELTKVQRQKDCLAIGLVWDGLTNVFHIGNDIWISKAEIESMSDRQFIAKMSEIKKDIERLNGIKKANVLQAPITVPVSEVKEPQRLARFEVRGHESKLKELRNFMINNNLNYKNI
jgi:hypothetical protein